MATRTTASKADEPVEPETDAASVEEDAEFDVTRDLTADNLIKDYVIASVAASIVPVAFFDIAAVVAIQLRMIQKLSQLYGKPFSERLGRKVIYALAGGVLGFGAGYMVAASATKLIPGIGWMVGMVSLPVVAGASTFAVGRSIVAHYENGGTLMDFNAGKMREFYKEQFEKGKELARKVKDKAKSEAETVAEEVAS
ncbi:YcjF family protein [uncultured Roseibium sp.]|uniref:YcjF family protein n=1 Tax=uncultured Roseibium sp. TaxID=1936171 RepID=UPI003217B382